MPRGRSANSVRSDSSDLDFDGIGMQMQWLLIIKNYYHADECFYATSCLCPVETEMEKLQRQFRIMERDRQAYSIQSQEKIRKQRSVPPSMSLNAFRRFFVFFCLTDNDKSDHI